MRYMDVDRYVTWLFPIHALYIYINSTNTNTNSRVHKHEGKNLIR